MSKTSLHAAEPTNGGQAIGVVGAGAMGAGIAQVAAMHGHDVVLADAQPAAIVRARAGHQKVLAREVEKQRLTPEQADRVLAHITYVDGVHDRAMNAFAPCVMVVEAIIEELAAKRAVFQALEQVVAPDAILATNTSSLSIAAIGGACTRSDRVIGVHFFNPAPVMPLVEIIPAITTANEVVQHARTLVDGWKKTTVIASDTPGFIVNRVARPFYSESLRLFEEGLADCATIDWALRDIGGFRMGPFELMDLIGNDINFAVTSSVFESTFYDARFRPAVTQRRMVEAGFLGRKSGRGYYDYRDGAASPAPTKDETLAHRIVDRVVAMLVNAAVDAVHWRIATPHDLELAMTRGVNYPKGLLAWGDEIGADRILAQLDALHAEYGDERYRASVRLRRLVRDEQSLLA